MSSSSGVDHINDAQGYMGGSFWHEYPTAAIHPSFQENTFRQGENYVLRRMNMLNRLINERGLSRTLHGRIGNRILPETGQRVEYGIDAGGGEAGFWEVYADVKRKFETRKEEGVAAGALAYLLPVGTQIKTSVFEGFPMGLLAWFIMEAARRHHNEDEISINSLEGLYISGLFYLFDAESRVKYDNEHVGNGEWISRTHQTISAYSTHIYYFPLKDVVPVLPTSAPFEFNFDRYFTNVFGEGLDGGLNTNLINTVLEDEVPTGSDMNMYVVYDSLHIAKMHPGLPTSIAVQNNTRRVRTAGLANVLTDSAHFESAVNRQDYFENVSDLYIPSGETNCFLACVQHALVENEVLEMWSSCDPEVATWDVTTFRNNAIERIEQDIMDPVLKAISDSKFFHRKDF